MRDDSGVPMGAPQGWGRVPGILADIFLRSSFRKYNYFSGTTSWAECSMILRALFRSEPTGEGIAVQEFESQFARFCERSCAVSFATGRMAFYVLLEAMGVGPGDEVILPAYNCVVIPNAVLYRGARPIYVDIDPPSFGMNPIELRKRMTPRTKVIVAQHSFGIPCRIEEILEVAGKVPVVEDCAHSLGAAHDGRKLGTFGLAALFSTDHTKMISTGSGGVITTADDGLATRLKEIQKGLPFLPPNVSRRIAFQVVLNHICTHPRLYVIGKYFYWGLVKAGLVFQFRDELLERRPTAYPYPARLGHLQAKLGISQLSCLQSNLNHRRHIAAEYRDRLNNRWPSHAAVPENDSPSYLRYPVLAKDPDLWTERTKRFLEPGDWFRTVTYGRWRRLDVVGYENGSCPVGEYVSAHSLNFPTHFRAPSPQAVLAKAIKDPALELLNVREVERLAREALPQ